MQKTTLFCHLAYEHQRRTHRLEQQQPKLKLLQSSANLFRSIRLIGFIAHTSITWELCIISYSEIHAIAFDLGSNIGKLQNGH